MWGLAFEEFNEVGNNIKSMAHDGRFLKSDKVSAFIFSFPNGTVFMENHRAKNKAPWILIFGIVDCISVQYIK